MKKRFGIDFRTAHGDLYILPRGDFDGSSAWKLINILNMKYDGKGLVIIDTKGLRDIYPFGCSTFRRQFCACRLPADRLFFRGEKARDMAPEGSRIIPETAKDHACACDGKCRVCKCAVLNGKYAGRGRTN
jgi:hypothetical protein